MSNKTTFTALGLLLYFSLVSLSMRSQATSTAHRSLQLSVFALAGDTYTGLGASDNRLGGRNLSLSAGLDLGFWSYKGLMTEAEVRGTYPAYGGHVDSQKSLLGGLRVSRSVSGSRANSPRLYGSVIAGRGQISYIGGYATPGYIYGDSSGNVYGAGGGFELRLRAHWALRGDAQFQHWSTPVQDDHTIYAKQGAAGIVYRFGVGERPR